jgi:flagellar protein FlbD
MEFGGSGFPRRELKPAPHPADKIHRADMIRLTRLNRVPLVLNSDLIEHIEVTPDTVITLTTGQILRVRETAEEVVHRVIEFRRWIHGLDGAPPRLGMELEAGESVIAPSAPEEVG